VGVISVDKNHAIVVPTEMAPSSIVAPTVVVPSSTAVQTNLRSHF